MTIEIIKRGVIPGDRIVKGTCSNCRSELQWKASDGEHFDCQREGESNSIACPVCKGKVLGFYQR
jgi:DNA-directed RNA polymerase subunit RPC12/RpoP